MHDKSRSDLKTFVRGVKINRQIAKKEPVAKLIDTEVFPLSYAQTDQEIGDMIRIYHSTGTCEMGVDEMSVVDPQLNVNGLGNVRIADASIMPRMVSCNLQATVIMTAERCAEFMRA